MEVFSSGVLKALTQYP